MRSSILLPTLACAAVAWAIIPAPAPHPTPAPGLDKRQQQPFSLSSVIPSAVDTRFYSKDGTTTKFVGSNSAYLSIPTVTGTSDGTTITTTATARMALFTGKPKGSSDTEYSIVVAPELADQIMQVMDSAQKRDLRGRALSAAITAQLVDLLGPEMAVSLLEVANLALKGTGVATVAGGVVALGELTVPAAALLYFAAKQFSTIGTLFKSDGYYSAVKVPNPYQNFRDINTCPSSAPKCSSCKGSNLICTSGSNNKCPCDEDQECKTGNDMPDCGNPNCKGSDQNLCTTGSQKGCPCEVVGTCITNKVTPDGWLTTQQQILEAIIENAGGNPSSTPECGTAGLQGSRNPGYVMTNSSAHATPHDILYLLRQVLCSDQCENPAGIDAKSVKVVAKNDGGCEISVLLSSASEAWAARATHSQGVQWQQCWDSFANATEKCTNFNPDTTGWVNGPSDYEFFQIGYRAKNYQGKLHDDFQDGDELKQWCGDKQPTCDSCYGGASNNVCTEGDFAGCPCQAVTATQPPVPHVTNCATAVVAADIICCESSQNTQNACAQKMSGCGVDVDLGAQCQSKVDPSGSGTYSVCGQFTADQGIVRGSNMENIAECLNTAFGLNAQWKYL